MSLPNYPALKQEISNLLFLILSQGREQEMEVFQGVPIVIHHEGNESDFQTVEGVIKDTPMKEFSIEMSVQFSELPHLKHQEIVNLLFAEGSKLGESIGKNMFSTLREEISGTGNIVHSKDGSFSIGLFLEMLEKVQIDFDDFGKPIMPSLIVNPKQREFIEKTLNEATDNETDRYKHIMLKKEQEWNARESNRKLVD